MGKNLGPACCWTDTTGGKKKCASTEAKAENKQDVTAVRDVQGHEGGGPGSRIPKTAPRRKFGSKLPPIFKDRNTPFIHLHQYVLKLTK